jgi:hypothetical protein
MSIMPADEPHALKAVGRFKMMLITMRGSTGLSDLCLVSSEKGMLFYFCT